MKTHLVFTFNFVYLMILTQMSEAYLNHHIQRILTHLRNVWCRNKVGIGEIKRILGSFVEMYYLHNFIFEKK